MPRITVLMPVYNAEKYLKEAVESILTQTFTDFEFLIIDDGSTDKSIEVVNSYDDNRIRLVKNMRNMGISKTLNKGVKLASADLIARMDADDISLPERLEKQLAFMERNPEYAMLSSNVEKINEKGESLGHYNPNPRILYFYLVFHCFGIYHPTVMYRKEAVLDVGMYPETHSEDYRLWIKLIRNYRFSYVRDILLKYRISDYSISQSLLVDEYSADEKKYIKDNLRYFAGNQYDLPDSWLEAYRNNFEPICSDQDVNEMIRCIQEVDEIAFYVMNKENVNREPEDISLAVTYKKRHLIEYFMNKLSIIKSAYLFFKTARERRLASLLVRGIAKRFKERVF